MKKIIFAVMMAAILATAGLATAQDWGKGHGMGYGPHSGGARSAGSGLWKALNLTPAQIEKMKALREAFFKETIPLRNELMSKKLERAVLWVQTNPDEEKILAKQKEINALRAQLGEKVTKNRLAMRKILTPEQEAKLINLRARLWRGHGRGCGSGPGPGYGRGMGYGPR